MQAGTRAMCMWNGDQNLQLGLTAPANWPEESDERQLLGLAKVRLLLCDVQFALIEIYCAWNLWQQQSRQSPVKYIFQEKLFWIILHEARGILIPLQHSHDDDDAMLIHFEASREQMPHLRLHFWQFPSLNNCNAIIRNAELTWGSRD